MFDISGWLQSLNTPIFGIPEWMILVAVLGLAAWALLSPSSPSKKKSSKM